MKTQEEITAIAEKAWMSYENDLGDDYVAFRDAVAVAISQFVVSKENETRDAIASKDAEINRLRDGAKEAKDQIEMYIEHFDGAEYAWANEIEDLLESLLSPTPVTEGRKFEIASKDAEIAALKTENERFKDIIEQNFQKATIKESDQKTLIHSKNVIINMLDADLQAERERAEKLVDAGEKAMQYIKRAMPKEFITGTNDENYYFAYHELRSSLEICKKGGSNG